MEDRISPEAAKEIDELAYDILMSLKTGLVVNVVNEYKLCSYIEGCDLSIMRHCPNLRELTEYFLDNGIDGAWNIGNMLLS